MEFALLAPVMIALIFGGLGLGILVINRMQLEHAAQQVSVLVAKTDCGNGLSKVNEILGYNPTVMECDDSGPIVEVRLTQFFAVADLLHDIAPFIPESFTARAAAVKP